MRFLLVVAITLLVTLTVFAKDITISNVIPRRDTAGNIMDAHDGNTFLMNGVYYYYAASYGNCIEPKGDSGCAGAAPNACGFRFDHNVSLFTSTDLSAWESHPPVFQMAESGITGILFCPKVLYRARDDTYVMWINWIEGGDFSKSFYAVATSPKTPFGPFSIVNKNVSTLAFADTGDFSLFQDDDDTAYIIYTAHIQGFATTHQMSVEQLTDDYLETKGSEYNSGFFGNSFVEAPAMFKQNGIYYALFGSCCCYCQSGSPVYVHTSSHPLGPYTTQNNVGADERVIPITDRRMSRQAALMMHRHNKHQATLPLTDLDLNDAPTIPAQQTDVFVWKTETGNNGFAWYGDRWQSAPDHIKGHDFTYWSPLEFTSNGNITAMQWKDSFVVSVA